MKLKIKYVKSKNAKKKLSKKIQFETGKYKYDFQRYALVITRFEVQYD